ncbi:hypothetical protein BJY00DRAFT_184469 [Aspergillus carlsbadensis]|nr:hypothetical protein BJY00DRAFT_184469 [Aspergillus carlsbadensis]
MRFSVFREVCSEDAEIWWEEELFKQKVQRVVGTTLIWIERARYGALGEPPTLSKLRSVDNSSDRVCGNCDSQSMMNFFLLIFLVFFTPLILFIAWLAFSSCLGSRFHSRFVRYVRPGLDSYGRDYLRTMANPGSAMSEQIEMDNMLIESDHEE